MVLQSASSFALTRILSVEAQHLIARLRADVQQHVLRLPVRTFETTKSGELVSRIMDDVEGVRNLVGTGLVQLVGGILTAVVALAFLISIDPLMTALTIVPLALFAVVSTKAFGTLRPAFRERGAIRADVTGRLTEALGGIRVIKGFHALEKEAEIFEAGVLRIFENVRKTLTTTAAVGSFGTFFMGLAGVLIMGYGGHLILTDRLTVGELFSFTLFLGFLVAPVLQMANIGTQMTEAFAGLDRTAELLSMPGEDDDPLRTVEMPPIDGHVRFEDVSFAYDPGKTVLHHIEFEAPPGTVIALVGSSGSGKSTLAALAAAFLEPDEGRVMVDGVNLREVILASYRSQLGLVLQDDFLFDGTIRENLLFARPDATEEDVREAAELRLRHRVHRPLRPRPRHGDRRAGRQALRRPAPAGDDRPGDPRRAPHPLPGRGDLEPRHRERGVHPGEPPDPAQGPHHLRHRPPPLDHPARRPDPGDRGRPDRRAGPSPGADGEGRALREAVHAPGADLSGPARPSCPVPSGLSAPAPREEARLLPYTDRGCLRLEPVTTGPRRRSFTTFRMTKSFGFPPPLSS